MPSITPITADQLPTSGTREGKVSTGLFRDFMDSGSDLAEVDVSDTEKSIASTRSTLSNYCNRHDLPIRVFTRASGLFLERCENGVGVVTGKPQHEERPRKPKPADSAEVAADLETTMQNEGAAVDSDLVPAGFES